MPGIIGIRPWAVLCVMAAGLAACTKPVPATKPDPATPLGLITRHQSMLQTDLPDSAFPALRRGRRWVNLNLVEDWAWGNGHLQIYVADDEHYHSDDYSDVKDLVQKINTWPSLRSIGVSVNADNISTSRNAIGEFLYALTEIDDRGDRCTVMTQAIPYTTGPEYGPAPSPESSQGNIFFYECWAAGSRSDADLEARLLSFAEGLTYVPQIQLR